MVNRRERVQVMKFVFYTSINPTCSLCKVLQYTELDTKLSPFELIELKAHVHRIFNVLACLITFVTPKNDRAKKYSKRNFLPKYNYNLLPTCFTYAIDSRQASKLTVGAKNFLQALY